MPAWRRLRRLSNTLLVSAVALLVVPAAHPLLIPLVGTPSHLLWWAHVLPVALTTYRHGRPGGVASIMGSLVLVLGGERLFGAGYGTAADWQTTLSLATALTLTNVLVAGFALFARGFEQQLEHNAYHDALTGLANRALLDDRLSHVIARTRRHPDQPFAVVLFDIDRFKLINDGLGHSVGDDLLVLLARRMGTCVRREDTVARLGGDEFVVVLEEVESPSEATRTARRIQEALQEPTTLHGRRIFTTASAGLVIGHRGYTHAEEVLRDADTAMYRAKARGHSAIEVFDPEMHAQTLTRLQLESDLRQALEQEEFAMLYQPLVSLDDGVVRGFEALVRWQHPRRGLVMPGEFISVAEETGAIVPLGQWVLRRACRDAMLMRDALGLARPPQMSVNLSPQQFADGDLLMSVMAILAETGMDPSALTLEITEGTMMGSVDTTVAILEALRALGIEIAMDDFGTGYSSLSYLHRFPITLVKIDQSFVQHIHERDDDHALVRTICTLARELGLGTVAEGIEHPRQRDLLRALGATLAQGYHFSPPLGLDRATAALRHGRLPETAPIGLDQQARLEAAGP